MYKLNCYKQIVCFIVTSELFIQKRKGKEKKIHKLIVPSNQFLCFCIKEKITFPEDNCI